jgi:hypothetical protein
VRGSDCGTTQKDRQAGSENSGGQLSKTAPSLGRRGERGGCPLGAQTGPPGRARICSTGDVAGAELAPKGHPPHSRLTSSVHSLNPACPGFMSDAICPSALRTKPVQVPSFRARRVRSHLTSAGKAPIRSLRRGRREDGEGSDPIPSPSEDGEGSDPIPSPRPTRGREIAPIPSPVRGGGPGWGQALREARLDEPWFARRASPRCSPNNERWPQSRRVMGI